jgi:hypothetical protein
MVGAFLVLVGSAVTLWVAVIYIFPAASRARFVHQVSAIRDDCDDALISGALPDTDEVRYFISKTDLMLQDATRLGGTSYLWAFVSVMREHALDPPDLPVYEEGLSEQERALMEIFDRRLLDSLALHIAGSSIFWWIWRPLQILVTRGNPQPNQHAERLLSADGLARKISHEIDERHFQHA